MDGDIPILADMPLAIDLEIPNDSPKLCPKVLPVLVPCPTLELCPQLLDDPSHVFLVIDSELDCPTDLPCVMLKFQEFES